MPTANTPPAEQKQLTEAEVQQVLEAVQSAFPLPYHFWSGGVFSGDIRICGVDAAHEKNACRYCAALSLLIGAANLLPRLAREWLEMRKAMKDASITGCISSKHSTSAKHDKCRVFSFAGLRPTFCPNCGQRLDWKAIDRANTKERTNGQQ